MNYGEDYGKVVVIVDIADSRRVLVEGPSSGFPRMMYPVTRLTLTKHVIKIPRGARSGLLKYKSLSNSVRKACAEAKLEEKWESTSFAKKLTATTKRAALNDFDRFKVMIAKKNRSFKVRKLAAKTAAPAQAKKGKK